MGDPLRLRESWESVYADFGRLRNGLFHGQHRSNVRSFPFRSIRALINATQWPQAREVAAMPLSSVSQGLEYKGQHPSDLVTSWTHEANGLTNDRDFWYSTQRHSITRISKRLPLAEARPNPADPDAVVSTKLVNADGFLGTEVAKHAGALVYSRGFLYVPIEENGWPGQTGDVAQVWIVDGRALVPRIVDKFIIDPGQKKAPWCAINEAANVLYTSDYFDDGKPGRFDQIRIYDFVPYPKPSFDGSLSGARTRRIGTLSLRTESGDPFPAEQVQGGIVTPNNHLLLVCDEPAGAAVSGLHLFDLMTGVRRWHTRWIDAHSFREFWIFGSVGSVKYHEAESVTICDAEGFYVHVLFGVKNAPTADGAMIMRFDTWNVAERWKL